MFDFSNYSSKSNFYDDSNKLVIGKMKDEMLRRFSFLIVNNKHKKKERCGSKYSWKDSS